MRQPHEVLRPEPQPTTSARPSRSSGLGQLRFRSGRRGRSARVALRERAARTRQPGVPASSSPDRILQLAWGYAPTLILEAALNYRLFDLLEGTPMTLRQVAQHTGASERGLRAVLNALVGLEFLTLRGHRYGLTPESSAFLVSAKAAYCGTYFMHMTRQLIPHWLHLKDSLRTGRPALAANRSNNGPAFFAEFVESLFPLSYTAARVLGEHLGIPGARSPLSVLDIGAGSGVWGIALARQSPQVRIRAVDWPEVLQVTKKVARKHGVADRLETAPGDVLEANFGAGHRLATIGHILHSEGPDRNRRLLRKTFSALAPGGTVAISEFLPNRDRTGPANALIFAVNMFLHTQAGDTYTFDEIAGWLRQAGFRKPRLLKAPAPSPLVLADRP